MNLQKDINQNSTTEEVQVFVNPFYCLDELSKKFRELDIKEEKALMTVELEKRRQKTNNSFVEIAKSKKVVDGDRVVKNFRNVVWNMNLTSHQLILNEIYLQANLENIYKHDFKENEIRIKQEHCTSSLRPYAFVSMPRRNGKTYGTGTFTAGALTTFSGFYVVVFAPSLKQCDFLRNVIVQIIQEAYRRNLVDFEIVKFNAREIVIRPAGRKEVNTILSLPTTVNTVRGAGANFIIGDELSFFKTDFILKMLLPLLTVNKTALAGISTVDGAENHFFKFIQMYDPTDPTCPIKVYQFFSSCAACRKKGVTNHCKHMLNERPWWLSEERSTNVKKMYKVLGGDEMADQELGGVVKKEKRNAFEKEDIDYMFSQLAIVKDDWFSNDIKNVYSFIDPTGGSASDLSIVTGVYESGNYIIIGCELIYATRMGDCQDQIENHYRTIRKLNLFKNSAIRIWIEGNSPWTFNTIGDFILNLGINNLFLMDSTSRTVASTVLANSSQRINNKNARPYTQNETKRSMYIKYTKLLKEKRVKFWEGFVSVHHPRPDDYKGISAPNFIREQLRTQHMDYCIFIQQALNRINEDKVVFTGKVQHGKSRDDGVIGCQMCYYWCYLYNNNHEMSQIKSRDYWFDSNEDFQVQKKKAKF